MALLELQHEGGLDESNLSIANRIGVTDKTVATARARLQLPPSSKAKRSA
jgi:hypothetical protein